jgi:hypothetical protein
MSWLTRYQAGDREGVWGAIVTAGPGLEDEATAVARELMGRVRRNVERLHVALAESGYRFALGDAALVRPRPDVGERIAEIEHAVGPVPLALRIWLEEVGAVNLTGTHPDWRFDHTDALVVECALDDVVDDYNYRTETGWFALAGTDRLPLLLAPDHLHKAGVSGGAPYGIDLPAAGADAPWDNDDLHRGLTFVEYLRSAILTWGGFPGWARTDPDVAPHEPWPPLLARLTQTLERF